MIRITLIATLLLLCSKVVTAQCDFISTLQLPDTPGQSVTANAACTDADGWTHYYNSDNNLLVLSVKKNGQDIGSLANGLTITTSTRTDYGNIGFNLSHADYINFDIWMVANRSWQITGANPINNDIEIRSYFNRTDTSDINQLKEALGISFNYDIPEKTVLYTISNGNGLDAYATSTQPVNATFGFFDTASSPPAIYGTNNDYFYGEFIATSTDIAGGAGLLIFVSNPPVSVSGNINRPNSMPVPGVDISVPGGNSTLTDANGNYTMPDLNTNLDYQLVPFKNTGHTEGVSVTDLIRLSRHLAGLENFTSPFEYIAADADNNEEITLDDVDEIRQLILGNILQFNNNTSWRFVPRSYTFPPPDTPSAPPFPERIQITDLADTLYNQNFTGIKIGDVGEASLNPPPDINPVFILPEAGTCNAGEEVVFGLVAEDFLAIRGFQFTLEWDPSELTFTEVTNFNLPGLSDQNIGTAGAADGHITFAWFNPAQAGTSLPDGSVLCDIKFITTGSATGTTPINFTGNVTPALVVHQNGSEEMPAFINGQTVVGNNTSIGTDAFVEPADCDGSPIGSIDLTVSGTVPPVNFLWSNGQMTEDISMLAEGTYTVTITDSSGGCPKIVSFEVPAGGEFDVVAEVMPMSCPTVLNGSIALNITGGMPPFTYSWSNGRTTATIGGLYQGMYLVTVTDAAGCTQTASFEIENPNRIFPVVTVMNSNNSGASNGSVIIEEIVGGFPPFTFHWSNGANTQSIMDVPPGNYAVTITDQIGCGHVFGYLVHDLMVATGEVRGVVSRAGVFPNPVVACSPFSLLVESLASGQAEVRVFAANGRRTGQYKLPLLQGIHAYALPTPGVRGLYFIQIVFKNEPVGWLKMVVQ